VEDLLREYERSGGGRIVVETYDPKPDSDEEEWAQRYGLVGPASAVLGEATRTYLGLVAVSGAREAAIPFLSPEAEPQLEYLLTRLVHQVTESRKRRIGVLSSLPVWGDPYAAMRPGGRAEPWVVIQELKQTYDVTNLSPDLQQIPADLDAVLVIFPQSFSDKLLFALDQHVLGGGRLMVFEDPLCLARRRMGDMEYGGGSSGDLNALTKAWGVQLDTAQVVADFESATHVRDPAGGVQRNATWLSLRDAGINRDDAATTALEFLMLPFSGAFAGAPVEGLEMTVLLNSSAGAGLVGADVAAEPESSGLPGFARQEKPLPIAVRLQGRFKTAFPEGRPKDPSGAPPPGPPDETPVLKDGREESVVVLVADADMIYDRYGVQQMNFFGRMLYQMANDNINFALNMVEQLTGSRALIGLRGRGSYERPFTRVLALERSAQERWRAEELSLMDKLEQARARLEELERAKDPGQKYILSPEQRAEIERFRREEFETRRQLKEVRRNLRREIESLGLKLKVLNIAAVPFGVALYGVARGWRRRKRAQGS
jgi:ABC-type uncharacterized transport system involved in gliding motility auxiliary subunit